MNLVGNDWNVSDNIKMINIFNGYFSNLAEKLKLQIPENLVNCSCQSEDPIFKVICKYQNHPRLTANKELHHTNHFSFNTVSLSDMKKLENLNSSKTTNISDIHTKIIKKNIYSLPFSIQLITSFKKIILITQYISV